MNWEPPGNLTLEASGIWLQSFQRTGGKDSGRARAQTKLLHTRTQEKGPGPTRTHKRLTQACPWVSRSLWRRRGQRCPVAGSEALSAAVCAWTFWREVTFIFITTTVVWSQVKQQGTQPTINRKLDDRCTEHGLAHQNETQFPSQSASPIRKLP